MPRTSQCKQKYNHFKRLFISSIYNRIAHEILFDDSSIGSEEEANINFSCVDFSTQKIIKSNVLVKLSLVVVKLLEINTTLSTHSFLTKRFFCCIEKASRWKGGL